jgi:HSP20 family protein
MRYLVPFDQSISWAEEMDPLFEESLNRELSVWPGKTHIASSFPVDLEEVRDTLIVRADLPGIKLENVDISFSGNTMKIKGVIDEDKDCEQVTAYMHERKPVKFFRTIALPTSVDIGEAQMSLEDGVLIVKLLKV